MSKELDEKLRNLEARIAATRQKLGTMTDQQRMEIGELLEHVSDRFNEAEAQKGEKSD